LRLTNVQRVWGVENLFQTTEHCSCCKRDTETPVPLDRMLFGFGAELIEARTTGHGSAGASARSNSKYLKIEISADFDEQGRNKNGGIYGRFTSSGQNLLRKARCGALSSDFDVHLILANSRPPPPRSENRSGGPARTSGHSMAPKCAIAPTRVVVKARRSNFPAVRARARGPALLRSPNVTLEDGPVLTIRCQGGTMRTYDSRSRRSSLCIARPRYCWRGRERPVV
jgi:hypothetical protein